MAASAEPPFSMLLPQAEALAGRRHEPLSQAHFLVALGVSESEVARLLEEYGAGPRRILDVLDRLVAQGTGENLVQLSGLVRDSARRFGRPVPTAPDLLLVLLNDSRGSGRAVLDQLGVDVAGLRAAGMQLVSGGTMVRPLPARPFSARLPSARRKPQEDAPAPASASSGVALSLISGEPLAVSKPSVLSKTQAVGQALPVVPQVGPTPLPRQRILARQTKQDSPDSQRGAQRGEPSGSAPASASAQSPGRREEGAARHLGPGQPSTSTGRGRLDTGALRAEAPSEPNVEPGAEPDWDTELVERWTLPPKQFPILTTVGRNLTWLAVSQQMDPVVGREEEIEQALDVLGKRQGNSPCLIGPAGVGKTAVARGVAAALAEIAEEDPSENRLVIEIPISELIAGTGVRGALAGRLAALKKEVQAAAGRVILFFDEMHQLFTGDAAEEIASDLKLALSRGELPCMGATTSEEYRRVIERDAALHRRFTAIEVEEPSREDAYLVLSSVAQKLERHHQVSYDEEALALAIAWSIRYLPGRALPDKAVSVIDWAGARCRRRGRAVVDPEAVAEVVSSQASMPISRLLESDAERMLGLEEILTRRVIGHEAQIQKMARILRRNAAGLGSRRPIGTFLLLGPTGVGKTETAKAIAEVLFHTESAMTRIDMAELSEAHSVAKLVGAPPGYVGHDAGGQLTEAVRRRPYQVVLLDEIEKAHPEVLTAFLAVFDEGRMTDSRGRLVDFTNTVIVLTSNLGASELRQSTKKRVGFSTGEPEQDRTEEKVIQAARRALPPELYNRLDEVLCFAPLTREDMMQIGIKLTQALAQEVEQSRGISLRVESSAIEVLLDTGGYEPELGARPLRRALARQIEAPLAEAILAGELESGDEYFVSGQSGQLHFRIQPARAAE